MRPLTEAEKFRAKGYTNYPEDLREESFASMSELQAMDDITKLCLQVKRTTIPCTDIVHEHICEVSFKDHGTLHVCGCHFTWRGRFKAWEKHERERRAQEASP